MTFNEYKEKIIDRTENSGDLLYSLAYVWLHPERIPLVVIGLGNCCDRVIRIPNWSDKIRVVQFTSGPERMKGIHVPIIGFSKCVFKRNIHVTDIILQNNIVQLPDEAFSGCTSLERITIPRAVKRIGLEVFKDCKNLKDIYFEGSEEEWKAVDIVYKNYRPINPKQLGLIVDMEEYIIPGNEAVFNATIHYNCILEQAKDEMFKIECDGKDVSCLLKTR